MSAPSGYNLVQTPRMSPEQLQRFQSLLGATGQSSSKAAGLLGKLALGEGQAYDQLQAPAEKSFNKFGAEAAQRYGGSLNSSGFQSILAGAGRDLASELALQRSNIQQNSLSQLLGLEQSLLGANPYNQYLEEKDPDQKQKGPSFLDRLVGFGSGALKGASSGSSLGPWGALGGGLAGGLAGLYNA